jgi:hypothetical protein
VFNLSTAHFRRPLRRVLLRILKRRHLEVVRQLKFGLGVALKRHKVHQQRVLDCKHGIVFNVLALAVEDLRDNRLVARRGDLSRQYCAFDTVIYMLDSYILPKSEYAQAGTDVCPVPAVPFLPARRMG